MRPHAIYCTTTITDDDVVDDDDVRRAPAAAREMDRVSVWVCGQVRFQVHHRACVNVSEREREAKGAFSVTPVQCVCP